MFCVIYINIKYQSKISKCIIMSINVPIAATAEALLTQIILLHVHITRVCLKMFWKL